jgi:hypothetical protein
MVASYLLLIFDIINFGVYIDLWVVNNFKLHIYTPFLKFVPKHKLKEIQGQYYASLNRKYFCVSDKVDVSGTTFTVVFSFVYLLNIILNVFVWDKISAFHFNMVGIFYFVYVMYSMTSYRGVRELCFYCKYPLI